MSKRHSISSTLPTATLVGGGGILIWLVVAVLAATMFDTTAPYARVAIGRYGPNADALEDRPFVELVKQGEHGREVHYTDLSGEPVEPTADFDRISGVFPPQHLDGIGLRVDSKTRRSQLPTLNRYVIVKGNGYVGSKDDREIYWYLNNDPGRPGFYFVGYDRKTKQRTRFASLAGPSDTIPGDQDLIPRTKAIVHHVSRNRDRQRYMYILADRSLYYFSGATESANNLLPDDEIIAFAPYIPHHHQLDSGKLPVPEEFQNELFVALTSTEMIFVNLDHSVSRRIPLPETLRNKSIAVHRWNTDSLIAMQGINGKTQLTWFSPDGNVIKAATWTPPTGYNERTPVATEIWWIPALFPGAVPAFVMADLAYPNLLIQAHRDPVAENTLSNLLRDLWPQLFVLLTLSSALAWHARYRMRQFGEQPSHLWTLFILAFGLFGYFGWRYHRVWPARIACPECSAATPCNQTACLQCEKPFPQPPLRGCEVFA